MSSPVISRFWRNEFKGINTSNKTPRSPEEQIGSVVKEYARYCTLHGIQYVFKENSTFVERIVWLAIVLASFICASLLVNTMWTRFSMSPTMTAVKDTHLPLYSLPFPAVSICSSDKIKREEAYAYLSIYVNLTNPKILEGVDNFLSAMSLFQHPLYSRMTSYLEKSEFLLPYLSSVNLTDFMLKVTPNCEEIFNRCFWVGKSISCCHLFKLQRTEEGFCYSFNSLTSHFDINCHLISNLGSYSEFRTNPDTKSCPLRRNTAAGSSSGLEIFLKSFNTSNRIVNASDTIGIPGHRVQIFYVAEYPEAGMGSLVESQKGIKLALTVKPSVTFSTEAIRHLDINDRFCYFPDEQQLSVSYSYSQKSCLIECRLKHLRKVCHCRPYYFNLLDNTVPVCDATQISCIAEHNSIIFLEIPKFGNLMKNVTVTVGRDTVLTCVVENLSTFKVAWLRVDTQTILTIQNHVITKNHRIAVSNADQQVWKLHIKDVRITDRGWYMCQINTDPMKSQTAYIEVVAPPDILDYPTSSDMVVREGNNVTLQCVATGSPTPTVTWKKEDGSEIYLDQVPFRAALVKNSILTLVKVDWRHSGIYLCIASNGVPPTVSKRISLTVQYAPKIHVRNQLVGATLGNFLILECETEAYPKPIHYWTFDNGQLLTEGERYETLLKSYIYKVKMKLLIREITPAHFRDYFCISKNPLGTSEGVVRVYPLEPEWIWKSTKEPSAYLNDTYGAGISTAPNSLSFFKICNVIVVIILYID